MPGIKLNFEFDLEQFTELVVGKSAKRNISEEKELQKRIQFALEPFSTSLKGNTAIGSLRCALWEAMHKADPQLFSSCKGIDLWFEDSVVSSDSQTLIDVVRLWNNSTLVITPSKSVTDFIDAFIYLSDLVHNKQTLLVMMWNALNEALKTKDLRVWDTFCAAILQFWSENAKWNHASTFLTFLLQFDPCPTRDFIGWRLLNVIMGTDYSLTVMKKLLICEQMMLETDGHGTNLLMHCALEDDCEVFRYIMQYGIDFDLPIDETNSIYDFVMIYGSMEMSLMMDTYNTLQRTKRNILQTHSVFKGLPEDLVNEIGSFLLGTDVMMAADSKEQNDNLFLQIQTDNDNSHNDHERETVLLNDLENSVMTYYQQDNEESINSAESTDITDIGLLRNQFESSANNLYEVEERLSLISVASG